MRYSTQIKPMTIFGENATQIADALDANVDPLILTDGGEAKAVLMSIREYERTQETIAFLKIIALAEQDIKAGNTIPVEEAFDRVRQDLRVKYG